MIAEDGNARPASDGQAALDIGDVSVEHSPLKKPKTYDPDRHRDWVRSITTYAFIGIFSLTIIASLFVVIWDGKDWSNMKDLIQALLPAETGLIGSAIGFYFGSETRKQRERD